MKISTCLLALGAGAAALIAGSAAISAAAKGEKNGFALVRNNGFPAGGQNVDSTERLNTGTYAIEFKSSVKKCAYLATLGRPLITESQQGFISVVPRPGSDNGIVVFTANALGDLQDRDFHVGVFCKV